MFDGREGSRFHFQDFDTETSEGLSGRRRDRPRLDLTLSGKLGLVGLNDGPTGAVVGPDKLKGQRRLF